MISKEMMIAFNLCQVEKDEAKLLDIVKCIRSTHKKWGDEKGLETWDKVVKLIEWEINNN